MEATDWKDARRMRPAREWHEEIGDVLWWNVPIEEPPHCGTPNDSDWPEMIIMVAPGVYDTDPEPFSYWTPIVVPDTEPT